MYVFACVCVCVLNNSEVMATAHAHATHPFQHGLSIIAAHGEEALANTDAGGLLLIVSQHQLVAGILNAIVFSLHTKHKAEEPTERESVCVCERERERQTDRETETERKREGKSNQHSNLKHMKAWRKEALPKQQHGTCRALRASVARCFLLLSRANSLIMS